MDKLFIDTNIILDILLERGDYSACLEILQMGDDGKVLLCTSYLSLANVAYIIRKDFSNTDKVLTLKQLSSIMTVLPMDGAQFDRALFLDGPDMEDIFQAECAASAGCDYIITHNPQHFGITSVLLKDWTCPRVMTPEEYLITIR